MLAVADMILGAEVWFTPAGETEEQHGMIVMVRAHFHQEHNDNGGYAFMNTPILVIAKEDGKLVECTATSCRISFEEKESNNE